MCYIWLHGMSNEPVYMANRFGARSKSEVVSIICNWYDIISVRRNLADENAVYRSVPALSVCEVNGL